MTRLFATLREDVREARVAPIPNLLAGLTVAIVALPLALAFGLIAFGPVYGPISGMIGSVIAGFIAAVFGGAPHAIAGPAGVLSVFMAGIVATHGGFGVHDAVVFGFWVVTLAGLIQLSFGLLKLGRIVEYIPYPVTHGFLTGAAIIIGWAAVKDIIAPVDGGPMPNAWSMLVDFATGEAGGAVYAAALLAAGAFALTFFYPKLSRRLPDRGPLAIIKRIPGSLIAIIALSLAAVFISMFNGVRHIHDLPIEGFGFVLDLSVFTRHPGWIRDLFIAALGLAALSSIDTLLVCVIADGVTGMRTNGDRELGAQGVANAIAGAVGGSPSCSAPARTVVNINNGGRTRLSGIMQASVLFGALLLLEMGLTKYIPIGVLAGILLAASIGMIDWRSLLSARRAPKSDTAVMLATTSITVAFGLVEAVLAGFILAAFLFIKRMNELTEFVGEPEWTGSDRSALGELGQKVIVYEIRGPLFFGAVARFTRTFENADLKRFPVVVFRMNAVTAMDETGLRALEIVIKRLRHNGQAVILSHVTTNARKQLEAFGLIGLIGPENIVPSFADAVQRARSLVGAPTHS